MILLDTQNTHQDGECFADRYIIARELGHGGMGVVYLACDRELQREVALKKMRWSGKHAEERFHREYRALAAIRHRGVPTILHSGRSERGEAFFTMELVHGVTLASILQTTAIEPVRALALAIDLGRVLSAVHAAGVVHRDVKPSNIIVEAGDRVRLIDFGASFLTVDYFRKPHLREITATADRFETGEQEWVGTASYTDPECLIEGATTVRSDVFSVCVVLYEMITGRRLYDHATSSFRKIDPREFPGELAALGAELRRGVARPSFERHPSMDDLVRNLEVLRAGLAAPRRRSLGRSVAFAALGAAALGLAGWVGRVTAPSATPPAGGVVSEERAADGRTLPASGGAQTSSAPRFEIAELTITPGLPAMRDALTAADLGRCAAGGPLFVEFVVNQGADRFAAVNVLGVVSEAASRCVRDATAELRFQPAAPETFIEEYSP